MLENNFKTLTFNGWLCARRAGVVKSRRLASRNGTSQQNERAALALPPAGQTNSRGIDGIPDTQLLTLSSWFWQVYCPLDVSEHTFHRMIYLFVPLEVFTHRSLHCTTSSSPPQLYSRPLNFATQFPQADRLTHPGAIRALRCQLPRENDFYEPVPSSERFPPRLKVRSSSHIPLKHNRSYSTPSIYGGPLFLKNRSLTVCKSGIGLLSKAF